MLEAKVLAAFLADRQVYLDHHHRVENFSAMSTEMLRQIGDYYSADEKSRSVDLDILSSRLDRIYGQVPKQRDALKDLLTEVSAVDVSAVNVGRELLDSKRDRTGLLLADAILTRDKSAIPAMLQEYTGLMDESDLEDSSSEILTAPTLSDLSEKYGEENLIKLAPGDLNRRVGGGLVRGQHLLIVALPETGKTLMALNLASGFAYQGLRVLYIGNEDPIESLAMRLMSNMSGVRDVDLFNQDEDALMQKVMSMGYGQVTFAGLAPGSIPAADALLSKDAYDVCILDQLRNFDGSTESNTLRMESISRGARNLARKHNVLMVSLTQASDAARDHLVLHSGMVDGSRIGMPATADVMVMVGTNEEFDSRNLRKLTIVKNKKSGVKDAFTVSVDPHRSRVTNFDSMRAAS